MFYVFEGKTRQQLAQRRTTEESATRRAQDNRSTGQGVSGSLQAGSGGIRSTGQGVTENLQTGSGGVSTFSTLCMDHVAQEPWLANDSLMTTSNVLESTTRDDEIQDKGAQPCGKRKRPRAGGVVFDDGQRVSDVCPPVPPAEPPPTRSPQRERYIKSLLTFKGVETRPLWAEALSTFYDIKKNVTRKEVDRMLREAGHFLEAKEVTTIYNKVKSSFNNHMK